MSAHILLNLLNKLRKRDKVQGLPRISSLFHNVQLYSGGKKANI